VLQDEAEHLGTGIHARGREVHEKQRLSVQGISASTTPSKRPQRPCGLVVVDVELAIHSAVQEQADCRYSGWWSLTPTPEFCALS
jgi:hypothetical protein